MAEAGAKILDIHSLENLNKRIISSRESMSDIDGGVVSYLNEVRNTLNDQLEMLKDNLNAAEQRLSASENSLSLCKASQTIDPTTGMIMPDCTSEEMAVENDRMEVEKWRAKCEQGERILAECTREIEDYNSSAGGKAIIQNICELQPKASQFLCDCFEKLQAILKINLVVNDDLVVNEGPKGPTRPQSPTDEGKVSHVTRCPNCGRPIPLCICKSMQA